MLDAKQKRELLVARATHLRGAEGGVSELADATAPRAAMLEELREGLLEERNAIADENRLRAAEAAGALQRNPRPITPDEEHELAAAGVYVVLDEELRSFRSARLDAIDRALDALAAGPYGDCLRCGRGIEIERLRDAPDTLVCTACVPRVQGGDGSATF